MLVLSRKRSETIRIGDAVELTVLQIEGNRVRLGIEAPDNISIQRSELACHGESNRAVSQKVPRRRK